MYGFPDKFKAPSRVDDRRALIVLTTHFTAGIVAQLARVELGSEDLKRNKTRCHVARRADVASTEIAPEFETALLIRSK